MRFLFPFCLTLSALLLFSIQPMVAKILLPVYGGTPAVWTICMVFFQTLLLVSYAYVWGLSRIKSPFLWRSIHCLLIALSVAAFPFSLSFQASGSGLPELSILYQLITQIGPYLFIIGTSAPLLQFAYSQTRAPNAADPYFLYNASNIGSLMALLLYPWIIERFVGVQTQLTFWRWGYYFYLFFLIGTLWLQKYHPPKALRHAFSPISWLTVVNWIALGFIPCSLMLGLTLYITTDIAPTPLFWVVPLMFYLLSFIVTFRDKPLISLSWIESNCLVFLIFSIVGFIFSGRTPIWLLVSSNVALFFCIALLCHHLLYKKRPQASSLGLFYFCLALGGVIAGIFNGIIAPHWFNQIYEYPLILLVSLFLLPYTYKKVTWQSLWVWPTIAALLYFASHNGDIKGISYFKIGTLLSLGLIAYHHQNKPMFLGSLSLLLGFIFIPLNSEILLQERSFYGVNQVINKDMVHAYISQSTLHGLQRFNPDEESKQPSGFTAYYGALKPVMEILQQNNPALSAAIMGLGTGCMACQYRQADEVKIIEIDQQVIDIAKNTKLFTYLKKCPPKIEVIKGDGRLALNQIQNNSLNLLILDAFNSDAVPTHLLTLEAFNMYEKKLKQDGAILVDLSNRHLDLLPVVNAIGRKLGMIILYVKHQGRVDLDQLDSMWALITQNENLARELINKTPWQFLASNEQLLWTDDYSNIVPLIRWVR